MWCDKINVDYYALLKIDEHATSDEIRAAYKAMALVQHPDRNRDSPEATRRFQFLGHVYSTLIDPYRREEYNATRIPDHYSSSVLRTLRANHAEERQKWAWAEAEGHEVFLPPNEITVLREEEIQRTAAREADLEEHYGWEANKGKSRAWHKGKRGMGTGALNHKYKRSTKVERRRIRMKGDFDATELEMHNRLHIEWD